jgi:hypothetical protein
MVKINIHPMWLILALLLGVALADFFSEPLIILVSILFGIAMMFSPTTPSQETKFIKNPFQTIVVWIFVILITGLLYYNYFRQLGFF